MKGLGLTPFFGDRRGFMPPQLKTKQNKKMCQKQLSKNVSKKFVRKCVKNQENTGYNIRQEHQGTHFCQ